MAAQFKVKDSVNGTYYGAETVTFEQADYVGCPGATVRLVGRYATTYGTVQPVTGRVVTVPGWSTRKGVLSVFTPWGSTDSADALSGYLTTD